MKLLFSALVLVVVISLLPSLASAELPSYDVSYTGSVTFTGFGSGSIIIPQWAPVTDWTLNSVTITFWDSGTTDFSVINGSSTLDSIRGTMGRAYTVSGTDIGFASYSEDYSVNGPLHRNVPAYATFLDTISFSNPVSASFTGIDPALYTGTGNVVYNIDVDNFANGVTASGGGNYSNGFANSNLRVGVIVTYNYTVPEPMSLALMGLTLSGVAFWRRRRTKVS